MTATIVENTLGIFSLCLTISFAKKNNVVNRQKTKIYLCAAVTTIVLLLLETGTVYLGNNSSASYVIPHRIMNSLGFSLSPLVPLLLLYLNRNSKRSVLSSLLLWTPLLINACICMLSYRTAWVFDVDATGHYIRGSFFMLPAIVSTYYVIGLTMALLRNHAGYEQEDNKVLILILLVPVLCMVIQIMYADIIVIWASVAISLLMYYVYLRELQFTYDAPTLIKNRAAFEKAIEHYGNTSEQVVVVVIDLNQLKTINDCFGHTAGDEAILDCANVIKQSFKGIGSPFRIGGDEFCVLCKDIPAAEVDRALNELDHAAKDINRNRVFPIVLAYGYSVFITRGRDNIHTVFTYADKAMYEHKSRLKTSV